MQKTADKLSSGSETSAPGMAAIVGLSPEQVEKLIVEWKTEGFNDIYTANINSPRQSVVSGTSSALEQAEIRFKEAGAKHVIRLQVSGPFHSPLMADAVEAFLPALEAVTFRDPAITIFSNVTGKKITSGAEAKKLAIQQITKPVRWIEIEQNIAALGIKACLETGPGKVLQGLWRDLKNNVPFYSAGTAEDIHLLMCQNKI